VRPEHEFVVSQRPTRRCGPWGNNVAGQGSVRVGAERIGRVIVYVPRKDAGRTPPRRGSLRGGPHPEPVHAQVEVSEHLLRDNVSKTERAVARPCSSSRLPPNSPVTCTVLRHTISKSYSWIRTRPYRGVAENWLLDIYTHEIRFSGDFCAESRSSWSNRMAEISNLHVFSRPLSHWSLGILRENPAKYRRFFGAFLCKRGRQGHTHTHARADTHVPVTRSSFRAQSVGHDRGFLVAATRKR
jgi:hypothetical protein